MTCRDVRDIVHSVRNAFERAPELQPRPEFIDRLCGSLRDAAAHERRTRRSSRRWFAIAAGLALAAGLAGAVVLRRSPSAASDVLAQDAIGDHRNCALKFRLVRKPVPLEEAAQRFDSAFRVLLTAPPDDMSTAEGTARVLERHACAYRERRFGHVVIRYQGHVVSLLVTANEGSGGAAAASVPRLLGHPVDGLSVVSVTAARHAVLLVSDLESAQLTQLSQAVSLPLAQRLAAGETLDRGLLAFLQRPERPARLD